MTVYNPNNPKTPKPGPRKRPEETGPGPSDLNPGQESLLAVLTMLLTQAGLGELVADVERFIRAGYDSEDAIVLKLMDTEPYKKRFGNVNDARRKKGIRVLTPREILAAEESYRQVLRSYGLPAGFYDQIEDFQSFLINDVSASELDERAQIAYRAVLNSPEEYKAALRDYYGIGFGELTASVLDPDRALPILQRMERAARIGGAAAAAKVSLEKTLAERYADLGLTEEQVFEGATVASEIADPLATIGRRYGEDYSLQEALDETVQGLASAKRKRQRISQREAAEFSQGSAATPAGLSARNSGSY